MSNSVKKLLTFCIRPDKVFGRKFKQNQQEEGGKN